MVKKLVKKVFNGFGYNIYKIRNEIPKDAYPSYDMDLYYQIYDKEDVDNRCFYNVGAGLFKHPAWTNIDYYSDWYIGNKIDIKFYLFIGENVVVGANSVVTTNIPSHCITAGTPAKIIKFKSYLNRADTVKFAVNHKDILSETLRQEIDKFELEKCE